MAGTNDFLPFAVGGSANVEAQATWVAETTLLANGFQSGVAESAKFNKALRQSSIIAAAVAQFIANSGPNVVDDGTTSTIVTNLTAAINSMITAGGIKQPVRAATTANIATLAGGAPNTLDGVTLAANDRILVKDQSTASQNGIYVVSTLGTGANGTWTRATDSDGVGELYAGMLVVAQEGTANADGIFELSTDGAITIGTTSVTFSRKDVSNVASVQGAFKNLALSATGLSQLVTVTADELVLEGSTGQYLTLRSINVSGSTGAAGAGGLDTGAIAASTWYAVWVISNAAGSSVSVLLSLSNTAPTMPGGYTHKARVGYIRTDASGSRMPLSFKQFGRKVQYVVAAGSNVSAVPVMASGTAGNVLTPTWVAVGISNFVPPTASHIVGIAATSNTNGTVMAAPNNAYGGMNSITNPAPSGANAVGGGGQSTEFNFAIESTNVYWAANTASGALACLGWEDNI